MDLKEIQNLIKFVANSGVAEVKLEMDDVKITIRTTLETNVTEATYVQQLPAQAALPQAAVPHYCCHPYPGCGRGVLHLYRSNRTRGHA